MKLKTREVFVLVAVISIALALPLSIWLVMKSQETRSEASAVEFDVFVNKSDCPTNTTFEEVGTNATCFDIINDAITYASAKSDSVITIHNGTYDQQAELKTSSTLSMVIQGEGTGTIIQNVTDTPRAGILGNGKPFQIDSANATVNFNSLIVNGSAGDTLIHIVKAKEVNLSKVTLKNGPTAGVYYDSTTAGTISDSTFDGNYWPGVSLHGSSNVKITNSTFTNHQHAGVDATDNSRLEIYGSTFDGNSVDIGGSIRLTGNSISMILDSVISNGGSYGISLWDSSQAEIVNNIISGNDFSGISPFDSSYVKILNNLISQNYAYGVASGDSSMVEIVNNTIINNYGSGIGLYNSCYMKITNNAIVDNDHNGIYADTYTEEKFIGTLDLNNNDVWGNDMENYKGVNPDNSNISLDPLFTTDGSYYLQPTSPAIDAGDPSILDPDGSRSDMGAWGGEYADWAPMGSLKKEIDKTSYCTTGIIVKDHVEYNDEDQSFTGPIGKLYLMENGKHYAIKYIKYSDLNKAITIPGSITDNGNTLNLKDGNDHKVMLSLYNLYTYTDLDDNEMTVRQDTTLGTNMWNGENDSVTINCEGEAPAVNQAPVIDAVDQTAYRTLPFVYHPMITDPEGDTITSVTITIDSNLDWLTNTNGTLTGTPSATSKLGNFPVTVAATDDEGNTGTKTFNVTVEETPVSIPVLNLVIDLQLKDDDSNSKVEVVIDGTTYYGVSNTDGVVTPIVLLGKDAKEYTMGVKPLGYLSREITANLVPGENRIVIDEEFLAGDVETSVKKDVVNTGDYAVLVAKLFQEDCLLRNFDGKCMVTGAEVAIMYGNWFKIGDMYSE